MGQMQWQRIKDGKLILFVDDGEGFKPYYNSNIATPDHPIPKASKGFATLQKGLKLGYKLLVTNQEEKLYDT